MLSVPSLGPPLASVQYVIHFLFCGWRHDFIQWRKWTRIKDDAYVSCSSPGRRAGGEVCRLFNCILLKDASRQTDRQTGTDTLITILRTPTGSNLKIPMYNTPFHANIHWYHVPLKSPEKIITGPPNSSVLLCSLASVVCRRL